MLSHRTRALVELLLGIVTLAVLLLFRDKAASLEQTDGTDTPDPTDTDPEQPTSIETEASTDDRETELESAAETTELEAAGGLEQPRLSVSGVVAGFGYGVCHSYLWDRDVWQIRSSWRRRVLSEAAQSLGVRVLTRGSDGSRSYSVAIGSAVGVVCYRIKYGLLSDPSPESE